VQVSGGDGQTGGLVKVSGGTGTSTAGGGVAVQSGGGTNVASGDVLISSLESGTALTSGRIALSTGGAQASGSISLSTGVSVGGNSGAVNIVTSGATKGAAGDVKLLVGSVVGVFLLSEAMGLRPVAMLASPGAQEILDQGESCSSRVEVVLLA
ncbi:hypothetical protein PF008_g20366, partial [Phytophthora fragariae]